MTGAELILIIQTVNILANIFASNLQSASDLTPEEKQQLLDELNKAKGLLPVWE